MIKGIKKNKKGFSLIELIIVIAIMVALIAVMAPTFVKYIAKAGDATLTSSAEDILAFAKTEFANGTLSGKGGMKIYAASVDGSSKIIRLDFVPCEDGSANTIVYKSETDSGELGDGNDLARFKAGCGFNDGAACKSDLVYYIYIDNTISSHPTLEFVSEESGD